MSKQALFNLVQVAFDAVVVILFLLQLKVNDITRKHYWKVRASLQSILDMLERYTREP